MDTKGDEMTTKEAMEALLEGKKITHPNWDEGEYVFLGDDGCIKDETGNNSFSLSNNNKYEIYKEPKPKVVIEKWLCKGKTGGYYILEASQGWVTTCEKVKLLDTYEITL